MKVNDHFDVVIVGAGAASSVYAALLSESGKRVLVLERGKDRKLEDLYSSQLWARSLKSATPHVYEESEDSIYHNFNSGHGVGGAAIHHYGIWPRFHPEDMKVASLYGQALDWPFEYDVLRPYYDQVQTDVGISGDAEREIWRPAGEPYPLPPVLVTNQGTTIAKGFHDSGLHTSPLPLAILSRPYKGRRACIWDGWCDAGCPIGALANPLAVYFPRAMEAGAVIKADSSVTRVLTDKGGKKAIGVEYYDKDGKPNVQLADLVVLAAFPIENTRILFNSRTSVHPDGLANSSGLLGRYLMAHQSVVIYGMFNEDMQNFLGATGGQLFNQDGFEKTAGAFGSYQWQIAPTFKPNDIIGIAMSRGDLFGDELHSFMNKAKRELGAMVGVCEDLPLRENKIELSKVKDEYGFNMALVKHTCHLETKKLWTQMTKQGLTIFKTAGAKNAWPSPQSSQHIMGGAIMGTNPSSSVTDENAQTHDIPNLVIGGASVFPTSSCANSTYTIHALAMKSSKYINTNWSSIIG